VVSGLFAAACACGLLNFLHNRLNMSRIPYFFPRSAYSTSRLLVSSLVFYTEHRNTVRTTTIFRATTASSTVKKSLLRWSFCRVFVCVGSPSSVCDLVFCRVCV